MAGLQERLDQMEAAIHKPSFRESSGRANEEKIEKAGVTTSAP